MNKHFLATVQIQAVFTRFITDKNPNLFLNAETHLRVWTMPFD